MPSDLGKLYVLACLDCARESETTPIPFPTATERGQWASEHTRGTGHDNWWVKDLRVEAG